MERVRLEELTAELVRARSDVCVETSPGLATVVRKCRRLLPFVSGDAPAPLRPADLLVEVPPGTPDPVATVRDALEALGFACDVPHATAR